MEGAAGQRLDDAENSNNNGLRGQRADKKEKKPIVKINVSVPEDAEKIIKRCAAILRAGEVDADDLKKFIDPMFNMTLDEVKKFAGIVLIDEEDK